MTAAVRRAWVPALLWLLVIACESMFGSSGTTSRYLWPLLHFLWPKITGPQFFFLHGAIRKAGHFAGYATLSFLFFRAWWPVFCLAHGAPLPSWRDMFRRWCPSAASVACACTVLAAALDEWNQARMPGRTSSLRDVLLDSSAAVFAQMLILAFSSMRVESRRGQARTSTDRNLVIRNS